MSYWYCWTLVIYRKLAKFSSCTGHVKKFAWSGVITVNFIKVNISWKSIGRLLLLMENINWEIWRFFISWNFNKCRALNIGCVWALKSLLYLILITLFCKITNLERFEGYVLAQTRLQYCRYGYIIVKYKIQRDSFFTEVKSWFTDYFNRLGNLVCYMGNMWPPIQVFI